MKILYVEDNEDNVYVLKSRLARAGYTVLIAADGAQGVTMAAAEQPNLILMDLSLPVLDGWEATRRIKAAPETRHIPVIALTAHAMAGDAKTEPFRIPADPVRLMSGLVGASGIEPETSAMSTQRSYQLSYAPTAAWRFGARRRGILASLRRQPRRAGSSLRPRARGCGARC